MAVFKLPVTYVDDKNLGALMRAIDGLVYMEGPPIPVRDAAFKNGKVKSNGKGGTAPEVVLRAIRERRLAVITRQNIVAILAAAGHKGKAQPANVVSSLTQAKVLRRIKAGTYEVLSPGKVK